MADKIKIEITAEDGATKVIKGVGDALKGMGSIAGGILGADLIKGAFNLIKGLGVDVVQSAMDAQDAEAALDATLRSTAAAAKDNARAIPTVSQEAAAAIREAVTKHTEALDDLEYSTALSTRNLQQGLAEMQERYDEDRVRRARNAERQISDLLREHEQRQGDMLRDLSTLEEDYGRSQQERQQQLADDLASLDEDTEDRRQELQMRLRRARTNRERAEIREQIAALEEESGERKAQMEQRAAQEQERAQRDHDRRVAQLQERIARENEEYDRQKTRYEEAQTEQTAIAEREYARQLAAAQQAAADAATAHARATADIEQQYAAMTAKINSSFTAIELGKIAPPSVIKPSKEALMGWAGALQDTTRFEDEQVMAAERVLLQFENIGGTIYERTLPSVLDLATATGQDASGAAMMLGKALDNPTESLGALERATGKFSDAQKTQIAQFMQAGDIAGAQNVILEVMQQRMGGLAVAAGQTTAGQFVVLNNKLGDVKESVGNQLLPTINTFLADAGPKFITFAGDMATRFGDVIPHLERISTLIRENLPTAFETIKTAWDTNLGPTFTTIANTVGFIVDSAKWLETNLNKIDQWIDSTPMLGGSGLGPWLNSFPFSQWLGGQLAAATGGYNGGAVAVGGGGSSFGDITINNYDAGQSAGLMEFLRQLQLVMQGRRY